MSMAACDGCLRRTWLLGRLGGYLEYERGGRLDQALSLPDEDLIQMWQQRGERGLRDDYESFSGQDAQAARGRAGTVGLELICSCQQAYPDGLRQLLAPPAVLYVAGGMDRFLELAAADPVALVGSRRATEYGRDVATLLGRGVSASGLTVVGGLASGVDAAAHRGALLAGGRTIAVLPGSAAHAYPRQNRRLHAEVIGAGVAVSEFGPGTSIRRWSLIARNRLIAALSRLTIVVQAGAGSGALNTVERARLLGRAVGAVPGSVLVPQSDGPNAELHSGAIVIRDTQDALDAVFGAGVMAAPNPRLTGLDDMALAVLEAIAGGADTVSAITRGEIESMHALAALATLELAGVIRRGAGGRYFATTKIM